LPAISVDWHRLIEESIDHITPQSGNSPKIKHRRNKGSSPNQREDGKKDNHGEHGVNVHGPLSPWFFLVGPLNEECEAGNEQLSFFPQELIQLAFAKAMKI
jgi:hypothetical protein